MSILGPFYGYLLRIIVYYPKSYGDKIIAVIVDYTAVALLAASPVGEELISIPAGWALGLPLWNVVVSLVFNFLPVPLLLKLMDIAGGEAGYRWLRQIV